MATKTDEGSKTTKTKHHEIIRRRWSIYSPFQRKGSQFYVVKVRDLRSGRVHWISTRQTGERLAKQEAIDWTDEQEAREQGAVLPKGRDFPGAFNEYLDLKTCRAVTLDCYRLDLEGIYEPAFKGKLLTEITGGDIRKFIADLAKAGKSARTRAKHLSAIRGFLDWCRITGYIATNPAEGVKPGRGDQREARAFTLEDLARLLKATREKTIHEIKDHRRSQGRQSWPPPEYLHVALALAIYTGARRRTIHEVTWSAVDLDGRMITFGPKIMKAGRALSVPIHPALERILRASLRGRRKVDPAKRVIGEKVENATAALHGACRRAKLPEVGWHTLRHSFATAIAERASFACLRTLLGHADGNVVTAKYLHPGWPALVEAIGKLPDLTGGALPAALPAAAP